MEEERSGRLGIRLLHEVKVEVPLEREVVSRHRASSDSEDVREHLWWKCDGGGEDVGDHAVGAAIAYSPLKELAFARELMDVLTYVIKRWLRSGAKNRLIIWGRLRQSSYRPRCVAMPMFSRRT